MKGYPMFPFNPFAYWSASIAAGQIMAESQLVIALRVAGMAGILPMAEGETQRMLSEKLAAGKEAGQAALRAGWAGGSLPTIVMAAMKPVGRRTRANARRLSRNVGDQR
ncbi:MAG: hypothetical protein K9G43_12960 [Rhodobacteraceae bacterium]|nr:hypothetical protein [Paracoccaceae bacterium]